MRVGSLFSGAGLGDIAVTRVGLSHHWFCEIDPFASAILARRWPGVRIYSDIREINEHIPSKDIAADILVGGFPCQDISCAGKRAGITGPRSGLWSEYARVIRLIRPRYVVVENVKALLTRGMDRVLGDLAACGYDAEWDVFPAAAFGAPHLRERVVLVAYPGGHRRGARPPVLPVGRNMGNGGQPDGPVDWNHLRLEGPRAQAACAAFRGPLVCGMADGGPHWMDRLRVLGNGIVPPVLEWVLRRVMEHAAASVL